MQGIFLSSFNDWVYYILKTKFRPRKGFATHDHPIKGFGSYETFHILHHAVCIIRWFLVRACHLYLFWNKIYVKISRVGWVRVQAVWQLGWKRNPGSAHRLHVRAWHTCRVRKGDYCSCSTLRSTVPLFIWTFLYKIFFLWTSNSHTLLSLIP